jgi:hypothetical protein
MECKTQRGNVQKHGSGIVVVERALKFVGRKVRWLSSALIILV